MRIAAVILDVDGVMLSTDELHFLAWQALAEREGIFFDRSINERLRGVSRMASLEILLERATRAYSDDERLAMATFKNELYRSSLDRLTPADVFPGVLDFLDHLRAIGVKAAVGSSSKNTKKLLERVGLLTRFCGAISDGTNISRSKPDPEVFLEAAAMIGVSPGRCLVIEDADAGVRAAKAGGMLALGVGSAARHPLAEFHAPSLEALWAGRGGEHAAFFRSLGP